MLPIGRNVAARVQLQCEIRQQAISDRSVRSHRQEHEIRLELELGSPHSHEIGAPVG